MNQLIPTTSHDVATTDLAEQMKFAELVTSGASGQSILPDSYRGNPANVLIAVGLGQAMGLSPAESLYRISVIKGKPSAGAELIAANVRRAGHKLRVRGDENSCTATIIRADDPDYEFTVTRDLAWAKSMGLASNDNYRKQPGTMLQWRAITAVARLACPEALYGVTYTPDEAAEIRSPSQAMRESAADLVGPATTSYDDTPAPAEPESITAAQQRKLGALMREAGITERDDALQYVSQVIGRVVGSRGELNAREAHAVIDALQADIQATKEGNTTDLVTAAEEQEETQG